MQLEKRRRRLAILKVHVRGIKSWRQRKEVSGGDANVHSDICTILNRNTASFGSRVEKGGKIPKLLSAEAAEVASQELPNRARTRSRRLPLIIAREERKKGVPNILDRLQTGFSARIGSKKQGDCEALTRNIRSFKGKKRIDNGNKGGLHEKSQGPGGYK